MEPNLVHIRATAPYRDSSVAIAQPIAIMGLTRASDGSILVLTQTEDGYQIVTLDDVEQIALNLILRYFEDRIVLGDTIALNR
jgi:hypothetical protein